MTLAAVKKMASRLTPAQKLKLAEELLAEIEARLKGGKSGREHRPEVVRMLSELNLSDSDAEGEEVQPRGATLPR